MKTPQDFSQLLAHASPFVHRSRLYQQRILNKVMHTMGHTKGNVLENLPEQFKIDMKGISVGVFDGEFEDRKTQRQSLRRQGVHKFLIPAYQRFFFH
ncbi:hypothetical protein [Acinetobacter sp. MD2(2019)]|uniref:hypothetical protein n=1 Tax=Acinetobacter sp. MD2(2019) TaxID=2605273 RepID=UPI002D1E7384|nr:hypothetical protein [Acinetobacter sp. MD2(2019)]MEB3753363.1 hypothetical protein [Acinetobacter sp. MD2(2019)]